MHRPTVATKYLPLLTALLLWGCAHRPVLELPRMAPALQEQIQTGALARDRGDYPAALTAFQQALEQARTQQNPPASALLLSEIGVVHADSGQSDRAMNSLAEALALYRELEDPAGEIRILNELGVIHTRRYRYPQAIHHHQQALQLARDHGDRWAEGQALANLATIHQSRGEQRRALAVYREALALFRTLRDPDAVATTLTGLGTVHEQLGQYQDALHAHQEAMALHQRLDDPAGQARSLNSLGVVYLQLGQDRQALGHFQAALALQQSLDDRVGLGLTLINLGVAQRRLGNWPAAQTRHEAALEIHRDLGDRITEGLVLINLGVVHEARQRYPEAMDHYRRGLAILQPLEHRQGMALALNNMGGLYHRQAAYPRALALFREALTLNTALALPDEIWKNWTGIQRSLAAQGDHRAAILAGKQAVQTLQDLRGNLNRLEPLLQQSFVAEREAVYRELADLLIRQGRLAEARQILDLLKGEEYFQFIRRDRRAAPSLAEQPGLSAGERAVLARYRQGLERLPDAGGRLPAIQQALDGLLDGLEGTLADTAGGGDAARDLPDAGTTRELQVMLAALGRGAVTVHTLMAEDTLHLLLTTPTDQVARQSPVDRATLHTLIGDFRQALQSDRRRQRRARLLGQRLYDHLIRPLADDLRAAGARTLMVSLDGALRYLPLAALNDDGRFLISDYTLVLYTPTVTDHLVRGPQPGWEVVGLGTSREVAPFPALPHVTTELEGIIRRDDDDPDGVLWGRIYLDEAFTARQLTDALLDYPVIHIATHFSLVPGNERDSGLLLGDGGMLTLAQLRENRAFDFSGVELLTLSACDTAIGTGGDGDEIDGLATLAQQRGARSVLATLWQVDDRSTALLMQRLYALHQSAGSELTKAEALRRAQLEMLEHERFRAPFFWAPFVLMGNWL